MNIAIIGTVVACIVDSGSNLTILSRGACDAIGLTVTNGPEKPTF